MIDRIFSAALAFCVLAAGTLAIASAMLEQTPQIVTMPRVVVIGKRVPVETPVAMVQGEQDSASQQQ
jgi:hypothetical protein